MDNEHVLYECGICSCYHQWGWNGDCRQDAYRYGSPEEYAKSKGIGVNHVEVREMAERVRGDY